MENRKWERENNFVWVTVAGRLNNEQHTES